METVLITGGTGFIGNYLSKHLINNGYQVIILTRKISNKKNEPYLIYAEWNSNKQTIDTTAIEKADHIIHLAGASVTKERWTDNYKKEIIESRTKTGQLIVHALNTIPNKVKTVIAASAIGWYGPDTIATKLNGFTEEANASSDFLGNTCKLWEESIEPITQIGKRLIKLRTGIVVGKQGGIVKELHKPLRFGVAPIFGEGNQIISWIHIKDLCRIYEFALKNKDCKGVYNATSPSPVSNREFTLQIAKKIKGNFFMPVHIPQFILKFILGEMSTEVLKSATINSGKIQAAGYRFLYPDIQTAVKNLAN